MKEIDRRHRRGSRKLKKKQKASSRSSDSGNDAVISAAIGKWQAQWHRNNPLFSQQEIPEIEALAKEESREARLLRQGFNSDSKKGSGNENDVSGRF